jgi:hypothetical protein
MPAPPPPPFGSDACLLEALKDYDFRSDDAWRTAGGLAAFRIGSFPTHGIRLNRKEGTFECTCMHWRRFASQVNPSVTPTCPCPGKKPYIKGWPEIASLDLDQHRLWRSRWPDGNRGALTGSRSRIVVIDADGEAGVHQLGMLRERTGPWPETWGTQSGSGVGCHDWYRLPSGMIIRNSASAIAPGIDVRGENGQIILPGSLHKSGNRYLWKEGRAPNEVQLAEMPQALVQVCLEACKKTRTSDSGQPKGKPNRTSRTAHPANDHDANSLLIGDGPGRGGFHSPINRIAIKYFGQFGANIDSNRLKDALRKAVLEAPRANHDDADIERYSSDYYLDEAIESARSYISEQEKL